MDGKCGVCGETAKVWGSPNKTDAGPWVCGVCASVVEGYLEITGYSLVIPVFPEPSL